MGKAGGWEVGLKDRLAASSKRPLESNPGSLECGISGWTPLKSPHRGEVSSGLLCRTVTGVRGL